MGNPPAHRDSTTMNGAQLLMAYGESSGLMCGPPARYKDPILMARLEEILENPGLQIEPVTAAQAKIAWEAYRDFGKGSGHPSNLNFGDCFTYALAREKREPVLWKGDDFGHTDLRAAVK
jgi:uncharacterized protein with PIN domain